jgi:8-oxo-dGTP pyrophosphatase MutT (NUDIX family)
MNMIKTRAPEGHFTVRVAGIAVQDGCVLLHTDRDGAFWVLPGGRGEVGEDTRTTLLREMQEEAGIDVEAGRLLWVMENFFELRGKRRHEIGFYYEMKVPKEWGPDQKPEFIGCEGDSELHFRWVPLAEIGSGLRVEPRVLAGRFASLPSQTEHVIYRD